GLQTHTVPEAPDAQALLARRLGFSGADQFLTALKTHTTHVRNTYERLFSDVEETTQEKAEPPVLEAIDKDAALATAAARVLAAHFTAAARTDARPAHRTERGSAGSTALAHHLISLARQSLNPHRALLQLSRITASLEKLDQHLSISEANLQALVQLCGSSDSFAEMIAANPTLITSLGLPATTSLRRDYRAILRTAIDAERTFPAEMTAFRLQWAELLVEIGALDVANELSIFEANRLQTDLATASMNVAYLIARREMARRYGSFSGGPRVAFYGLGRLGSGGVDYGSDLDILITYDSLVPSPIK